MQYADSIYIHETPKRRRKKNTNSDNYDVGEQRMSVSPRQTRVGVLNKPIKCVDT